MGDGRGIRIGPKLTTAQRKQRNVDILADHATGMTMVSIGARHGLSPSQVRVVIAIAERHAREAVERAQMRRATEAIGKLPLESLELSVRTTNCLYNMGCKTVGEALQLTDRQMLETPNFGLVSLREWKDRLHYLFSGGIW